MKLNAQQEEVAEHVHGRILTLAGPGSGKTRTLTERTGRLIRKGYDPASILCLTFTNKARDEMRARISAGHGKPAEKVFISNFHGLCGMLLRKFGQPIGYSARMTICDSSDQLDLILQLARRRGIEATKPRAKMLSWIANDWRENLGTLDTLEDIAADRELSDGDFSVIRAYVELLQSRNQCDFSGLLSETARLLRESEEVRDKLHRRFRFIQVDEYQDTNKAQNAIVELLAGKEDNVLAVGDGDQCVIAGTTVYTKAGPLRVERVRVGANILAGTGSGKTGFLKVSRVHRKRVRDYPVVTIRLKGGASLTATREHVHFAEYKQRSVSARWFTYLMFREDRGFRLGVTRHLRKQTYYQAILGFKGRLNQEEGDAIWLLNACDSEAEARFHEQYYSLQYGIPTTLFDSLPSESGKHACAYASRLFEALPTRESAQRLLNDLWMHELRPHHRPRSTQLARRRNFCIALCGDNRASSLHSYQISGSDAADRHMLDALGLRTRAAKASSENRNRRGWRVESSHADLGKLYEILTAVQSKMHVNVIERARLGTTSLAFTPASHVRPGMEVFVERDGKIVEDVVESVEMSRYTGTLYDFDVSRCHNYVANKIVTHNSIYEWRGATPEAIPTFIEHGKRKTGKCAVVKLGLNYRSTPQIIATADTLIRHCADRTVIEFETPNPPGELVKCVKLETPELEAEAIGSSIANTIKSGTPAREIAVFFRTNDMSRLVEQALAKRQIAYQVIGAGSYYDRMEVKDVISMLRFVCNPKDGISFHRIANKPARGMGDTLIGRLEAYAEQHKLDLLTVMQERHLEFIHDDSGKPLSEAALEACRRTRHVFDVPITGASVADIASDLLSRSQYDDWLKVHYEKKGEYEDRNRNVGELMNAIADYAQKSRGATVAEYLASISLFMGGDDTKTENAVRLMSLHASKGLEFDVVYLIGVEHNILPHAKAVADRGPRGLDEERRLCYVGFTRARKILRVTWCQKRQDAFARGKTAKFKHALPSRFLLEAGLMTQAEYQKAYEDAGIKPEQAAIKSSKPRKPPKLVAGRPTAR